MKCPHCNKKICIAISNKKAVRVVKNEEELFKLMKDDRKEMVK